MAFAALFAIGARAAEPPRDPGMFEPSLSVIDDGFVAAWYEYTGGATANLYLRRIDEDRAPGTGRLQLTSGTADALEPDVVVRRATALVAWYEKEPKTGALQARLGAWSIEGRGLWRRPLSLPSTSGRNPVVRIHEGSVFAAWIETSHGGSHRVVAQWFDLNGDERSRRIVIGPASATTWNLNAAIDRQGRAWLVYDADVGMRQSELFLALIDAEGARLTRTSDDDGFASKYPDIRVTEQRLALTWFDDRDGNQEVYLAVGDLSLDEHLARKARRVTHTSGPSYGAYLAWNQQQLGLAWCEDSDGKHAVHFQPFDAQGIPLTAARRLSEEMTQAGIPAIQPWRDGFALIWTQTPEASGTEPRPPIGSTLTLRLIDR